MRSMFTALALSLALFTLNPAAQADNWSVGVGFGYSNGGGYCGDSYGVNVGFGYSSYDHYRPRYRRVEVYDDYCGPDYVIYERRWRPRPRVTYVEYPDRYERGYDCYVPPRRYRYGGHIRSYRID